MSSFGNRERALARVLAGFPRLKRAAKWTYARAVYLMHRERSAVRSPHVLQDFGEPGVESFFGYYDKRPVSADGRHLAWHETRVPTSGPPDPAQSISVVIADAAGTERARLQTRAYNWQQGARLLWLDDDRLAFNDFDAAARSYVTRIVDVAGADCGSLPVPLADAHARAGIGISLNFRRLAALRPDYGYFNLPAEPIAALQSSPADDGLWQVELASGRAQLVVSLADLARQSSPGAVHKVNHPMISPDGRRCIFLHRYLEANVRKDRLMLLSFADGSVRELTNTGMVSHMAWRSDAQLVGYLRGPDGRDGFFALDPDRPVLEPLDRAFAQFGDGHPSVSGGRFVVWDTYPDKARMQHLLRADLSVANATVERLGSFFHGFGYQESSRCDLHPRFGLNADEMFFDSVCNGRRRLWRLRVQPGATGGAPR
jgi:hypothetical protein